MNTEFSQVLANEMVSFIGVFLSQFAYIQWQKHMLTIKGFILEKFGT